MARLLERKDHPLISVVMPVYNSERYVADAIQSILVQTYPHFEFIIVDDGSTDDSPAVIREFAARDARIHPFFLTHGGIASALNAGVALARGNLIARMDADDIALPERFVVQLAWMRRTEVDICGGCVKRFGSKNGLLWFPETHEAIRYELLFRIGSLDPTVLMRAEIIKTHLYDERAKHENYEILTRLAPHYRMGNVPQVLLKHRCHTKQIHIVQSVAFRAALSKFRRPYFHGLFPDATGQDYAALARIAECEAFTDLAELKQAGKWLVRLAQTPDNFLRQRMAQRWLAACQRSAHLGLGCYRVYRQIALQFGVAPNQRTSKLWLACVVRFRSNSRLYGYLLQVKRRMKRRPCLYPISL